MFRNKVFKERQEHSLSSAKCWFLLDPQANNNIFGRIDTWYSVHRSSNLRENKERPAYYVAGPYL